jgi:CDP-diacylglycerol pyrophosphatase
MQEKIRALDGGMFVLTVLLCAGIRRAISKAESDARSKAVGHGMKKASILLIAAGFTAVTAFATFAAGLDRLALWPIVRACVADFKLTGAPFPCLKVDLAAGEERGNVVLRSPLSGDMILTPTRKIVGVEDPFLLSAEVPNYFDAGWNARSFLEGGDGRAPERDAVALIVNSAVVRTQDQLHIHVGCLLLSVRRALAAAAPEVPIGEWARIDVGVPHTTFWGTRVQAVELSDVEPFRLAAEALADKVRDRRILMIMVAGVRVHGQDEFLILASYAGAPHAWWPVGAADLLNSSCPAGPSPG